MVEVNNGGLEIKVGLKTTQISDVEDYARRNDFFEATKVLKCNDLEDMVFRKNSPKNEIKKLTS